MPFFHPFTKMVLLIPINTAMTPTRSTAPTAGICVRLMKYLNGCMKTTCDCGSTAKPSVNTKLITKAKKKSRKGIVSLRNWLRQRS